MKMVKKYIEKNERLPIVDSRLFRKFEITTNQIYMTNLQNHNEVFKPVIGYEEFYEVGNLGTVKSLNQKIEIPSNTRSKKGHSFIKIGRILKPQKTPKYLTVTLCKNKIPKIYFVHRLVASCFIANPYNKKQVNHINGNVEDNRAENLEWVSSKENHRHAFDVLKRRAGRTRKVIYIDKNGKTIKEFESAKEASKELNIAPITISKIARGKQKYLTNLNSFIFK